MARQAPGTAHPRGGSGAMFDAIAHRYDLLNRVLSLGLDGSWRREAVAALALGPGARLLDLATGTADLALEAARARGDLRVTGVDPSPRMLEIGRAKVEQAGLADRIELRLGEVESLPFPERSFDAVTIAFGIRNVPDRERALGTMRALLRPGGRLAVLELSEPRGGLLGLPARLYLRGVVPRIGAALSGAREYRYLQTSIAAFPPPSEFADSMRRSGLEVLEVRALSFGVCQLFLAARGASR